MVEKREEEAPGKTPLFRAWIPWRAPERQEVGTGFSDADSSHLASSLLVD